ncbi:hypothetical protein Tco_0899871 [Tanacetum coccineum]
MLVTCTNSLNCLGRDEGRLRCKGVTKQIVGVIPKGLALRIFLVDLHSKDESGKGFNGSEVFKLDLSLASVGIKRLIDVLEVTAAKLMLLVYKLLLLVFRVNAAERLQLLKDYNC